MNTTRARRGFTLLEILVAVGIIAIILGLTVTAGLTVIGNQTAKVTESVIQRLDGVLDEYYTENGAYPSYSPGAYDETPGARLVQGGVANIPETYLGSTYTPGGGVMPGTGGHVRHPDASVLLRAAAGYGRVDSIITGLGERFAVPTPVLGLNNPRFEDLTPSVLDAWGDADSWATTTQLVDPQDHWSLLHPDARLIFFVHPSNRLAQDLYGRCVNGRPYFMSAGPDGLYGTTTQLTSDGSRSAVPADYEAALGALDDNIYSYSVNPAIVDVNDPFQAATR